jgi:2,3,4,5-tetrahydropyridine-2-carboxylate N-succinyltransferase/tetrahydrodipicolinate N-acetyltransferase
LKEDSEFIEIGSVRTFSNNTIWIGEFEEIQLLLKLNKIEAENYHLEIEHLNSAVPLADYTKYNARIEPGVIIRDMVEIGDGAIIMFGACINIGSKIGKATMIDMNAVLGGRAEVGDNCHIGAGAVIAGVIEPASALPVVIEDDVLVGANAVVLEGCRVGKGSVVAAGAIVTKDVPPYSVVAGAPAKIIKEIDAKTKSKTEIVQSLRNL